MATMLHFYAKDVSSLRQWNRGFALVAGQFVWIAESDAVAEVAFLGRLEVAIHDDGAFLSVNFMAIKRVIPNAGAVLSRRKIVPNSSSIMKGTECISYNLIWADFAM
jgi:hypothetical protein